MDRLSNVNKPSPGCFSLKVTYNERLKHLKTRLGWESPMPELVISLLGPFALHLTDSPATVKIPPKVRALIAYLATEADRAHERETLAGLLWPEFPQAAARHNLRQALSKLRRVIPPTHLQIARQTIQFIPDDCQIDVAMFAHQVAQCQNHRHPNLTACEPCMAHLEEAAALYRGDFLASVAVADSPAFEEWATLKREWLRREVLLALYALADHYRQRGDYETAHRYARRQVALDSLREEAHRQLMRIYAEAGQQVDALRQYQVCADLLETELGLSPATETIALYEQIRNGGLDRKTDDPQRQGAGIAPVVAQSGGFRRDWGEAPDVGEFYGRQRELAVLRQWFTTDRCRVVAVLGMGGIGKTALATKVTAQIADHYEYLIWRSLRNAPLIEELLAECIPLLSNQQMVDLSSDIDRQISLLLDCLHQRRCLLVLDNMEAILREGERAGQYRPGYEGYGRLLRRVGETGHQSCLLLTSREKPREVALLEGDASPVKSLNLSNLDAAAGRAILEGRGLVGTDEHWSSLVDHYSGNPLALTLIAETIRELFGGDIGAFLQEGVLIFAGVGRLLDQQFARLSDLEQTLMIWLAIEREAVGTDQLGEDLVQPLSKRALLEALRSLRRRSLVENSGRRFTLQNMVMEYMTEHFVETVCRELEEGLQPTTSSASRYFNRHALIKAQAKDYVRASQIRLILQPVVEWLLARFGQEGLEKRFREMLPALRQMQTYQQGYVAGNILNLLIHLGSDLKGFDFSAIAVWQVSLQDVSLPGVNFSGADLKGAVFSDTFGFLSSGAFSPDGQFLAVGTTSGQIRIWRTSDWQPVQTLQGTSPSISSLCFSPDGRILTSGNSDQTVCLWDVETGRTSRTLIGHTAQVGPVCFSPDGQLLASGSDDQTIRLWDVATGQVVQIFQGHTNFIWSVCFSPNGQLIASGGLDDIVRLWDAASGQPVHSLQGHTYSITSVCFSPDGKTIASGSLDRTIRLWDAASGQLLRRLNDHSDFVWSVCFSPDGQTLASGSWDQTIRLWNIETGQTFQTLYGDMTRVMWITFSPDGQTLASGNVDYKVSPVGYYAG